VTEKPLYLGDGVYASFDGYQIWLSTESEDGPHRIALEPLVYEALRQFARRIGIEAVAHKEAK